MKLKINYFIFILFLSISTNGQEGHRPPSLDFTTEYIKHGYMLNIFICNNEDHAIFIKTPIDPIYNSDSISFYFAIKESNYSTNKPFYDSYIQKDSECVKKRGIVEFSDYDCYPFITVNANSIKEIKFFIPKRSIINKEINVCFEYALFENELVNSNLVGIRRLYERCVHVKFIKK